VELPSEPSEEQLGWLDQMSTKSGPEFDAAYAQLLRAAHGKVFSVVAQVRAGTRNDAIREFAGKANEAVKTHMTLLESTGEVDFNALPEPALPGSVPTQHHDVAAASAQTGGPGIDVGIVIAICIVELVAVVGLLRVSRGR